jgi:hypothetical protein
MNGRYNANMQESARQWNLPRADQISLLAVMILLAYALASFIEIPGREFGFQLPGVYLSLELNFQVVVAGLVTGMTAAGTHQILRGHPKLNDESTVGHWLLPALSSLVIGLPLYQLSPGLIWWFGYLLGGGLLILVVVAEYITVDQDDRYYTAAAVGLFAISFALFLTLVIMLRITATRLLMILPVVILASGLVSLRTLHLRIHAEWQYTSALVIAFIVAQLAAALHYWPVSPVAYGLALLAPAYSLTNFLANIAEGQTPRRAVTEPALVLGLIWGIAIWMRQ